jgi:hypothetical protein
MLDHKELNMFRGRVADASAPSTGQLIHKTHHPDFFIFDAFQHLWLEDTTPHFRD